MTAPSLELSIQVACPKDEHLPSDALVRKALETALTQAAEITVRFVDLTEGQTLNHDYRGKDYATNILSFGYDDEDMPVIEGMPLLGDLVLCHPVVCNEATTQGKSIAAHYTHLLIHGALHLQGYDHLTEAEAAIMELLETKLLATLGIADPYDDA